MALVTATSAQGIVLRCSRADCDTFEPAEEEQIPTGPDYGQQQMLKLPYSRMGGMRFGRRSGSRGMTSDCVPLGKAEVRGDQPVYASDGALGNIEGLLTDSGGGRVTHVLLAEGSRWSKKERAIPISAVTRMDDGVVVSFTKDEVQRLPPFDRRGGG